MQSHKWIRTGPGKLELTTWVDGSRVIYAAVWHISGWSLTRRVVGAVIPLAMTQGERSLAAIEALIEADMKLGL